MAEESGQEKSEEPTGKREEEFRSEGQIAKSPEIGALLVVAASMICFASIGGSMGVKIAASMEGAFVFIRDMAPGNPLLWLRAFAWPVLQELLILFAVLMVVCIAGSMAQTGIMITPKALNPKPGNLNPFKGIKRIFSMQTVVQLIKSSLKVIVIMAIVYYDQLGRMNEILMLPSLSLMASIAWMAHMIGVLLVKICIFMAAVALFDYLYQWFSTRKKMMMTRQEVRDEMKESEVSPHVRGKVRQMAQELSKRQIQKEVPKADVIITNPTHYAIAVRYRRYEDRAPKVVAKGKDLMAANIRRIAQENNIPMYEYPELARSLYRTVKAGKTIPSEFYEAVARVLSFIYKLRKTGFETVRM